MIAILADEVSANHLTDHEDLSDPFEIYARRVQARIFSPPEVFKKRCLQGYRSLTFS